MKSIIISVVIFLNILLAASPVLAGDPFAGSNIYVQHCANCHGGDGRGVIAGTPSFRGGVLMTRSDSDLKSTIRSGKNVMPAFRGLLDDQQIDDVVTYIRTFN